MKIKDVAKVGSSKRVFAKEYAEEGIPFLRSKEVGNLHRGEPIKTELFISRSRYDEIKEKYGIPKRGDLLLTSIGSIGNTWIVDNRDFYFKDGNITHIQPTDRLDSKYLMYFFKSESFKNQLSSNSTGTAYSALTINRINDLNLTLPSLKTQQKIAAILDEADKLSQLDKKLIKKHEALSQNLFLEMFRQKDKVGEINQIELGKISKKITDGTHHTPKYTEDGIPFLRVTDITKSNKTKKFISKEEHLELIKRCMPEKDDILYTKNGTIGVAKTVDWDYEFSIFVSLCLIKPKHDLINNKFLEAFLNTSFALKQANSFSKTGTITNLHLVEIKKMKIPLPSMEDQLTFVSLLNEIESQKAKAQEALDQSEQLFNSLLQKAFRGELV